MSKQQYIQNYNSTWGSFLGTAAIGVAIGLVTENPFLGAIPFIS